MTITFILHFEKLETEVCRTNQWLAVFLRPRLSERKVPTRNFSYDKTSFGYTRLVSITLRTFKSNSATTRRNVMQIAMNIEQSLHPNIEYKMKQNNITLLNSIHNLNKPWIKNIVWHSLLGETLVQGISTNSSLFVFYKG